MTDESATDEDVTDESATDDMTGPWVLALGTLAVGVGAVTAAVLRRRRDRKNDRARRAEPRASDSEREAGDDG